MSLTRKLGLGLQNFLRKSITKLKSLRGSNKSIAEGVATGAAVSFTPFVGFHLLLSLILAKATKQNGVAAALGTIIGNPWTFPFIWYADLRLGEFILTVENIHEKINFTALFKELYHCVIMLDFDRFFSDIYPVFMPMLIGCIPFCVGTWFLCTHLVLKVLSLKADNGGKNDIGTGL